MGTPSSNQYFEALWTGPGTPSSPNLFTAAELVAGSFDSAAVSAATSAAVSTVNAAAPDSTSISQARSQAVSAATNASIADSKAVSNSANVSVADSKAISVSGSTSIADSKAVSVATATPTLTVVAASQAVSTADSKAVSAALIVNNLAIQNVRDKGALGDATLSTTGTDDYAAFQAAHDALPTTGGTIVVPPTTTNVYRLSQTLNITKPVRFTGSLPSSAVAVVNTGTVLKFDADKDGIIFNGDTTLNETVVASRGYAANYSILEGIGLISAGGVTGLLNGGTGVDVDAIKVRCPGVTIQNCWGTEWKRNGLRIKGQVGGGGSLEGNDNLTRVLFCYFRGNGSDGVYTEGNDANVCLFVSVDCTGNGGWGFNDTSAFANGYVVCHTSSNTSGGYRSTGASAHHSYFACYTEYTGEPGSNLGAVSNAIGGFLGTEAALAAASAGFAMSGGISHRAPISHQNVKGAASVGAGMGSNDTLMTGHWFGSSDDTATLDAWKWTYDSVNLQWDLTHRASGSRKAISIPAGAAASLRAFGPNFRQGAFFGSGFTAGGFINFDSAIPSSGTWVKADRKFNNYTVKGTGTGINAFYCQTAGTPGTWVAERAFGTFTCAASATTTISDTAAQTTSRIVITPTNATAGTLQAGANALYVSAKTTNTSFAVTTAAGGAPVGNETFDYVIFN